MHSHAAEAEAALVTSLRARLRQDTRSPKAPYRKASYTKESALPRISHLGSQSCLRTFIGGKVAVP